MFVEQDFDEVDRAGEVGVREQGVEFGPGFDAVVVYAERLREQAEVGVGEVAVDVAFAVELELVLADEAQSVPLLINTMLSGMP